MTDDAWRVELTRAAQRDLRRLDPPVRRRVIDALVGLRTQPPTGDIRPSPARTSNGDWRVRFTRNQATRTVDILRVLPRDRAYRD